MQSRPGVPLPKPPYRLDWYNGFSPEQRWASIPLQKQAIKEGRLAAPSTCSICGFSDPADPKGRGYIFMHLEDYEHPAVIHPACKSCHAALHARFRDPQRWLRIIKAHFRDGAWFTLLSMDPASQKQPFSVTYPDGLPAPV